MKKTGQRLRESREQQNLTIREVSRSTKINYCILQAMEAGEFEKLPAISFLRGFIRTYAAFLKIDGNELLQLFSEELHEKTEAELAEKEVPQEQASPWYASLPLLKDSSVTSRSIAAAAGVILLIIVIIGIKNVVDKYKKEGDVSLPIENIESLKHEKEVTTSGGDQLQTIGKTGPSIKPLKPTKSQAKTIKKNGAKKNEREKRPVLEKEGRVEAKTSITSEKKEAKIKLKSVLEPEKVVKKEKFSKPKKPAKSQEVILEALDSVQITFRIDGGELEKLTLQPEQIHAFKGKVSVIINLNDGGAVNIIHNGIDRGVPGDLGKPKKIKYP